MSKSLSITLALLSGACEPITTKVVELPEFDASDFANEDARVQDEPSSSRDGGYVSRIDQEEGCVSLLDQSRPQLVLNEPEDPIVLARSDVAAGCADADAGMKLINASVFSRRDGGPLVERGQAYSYRWPSSVAMTKVNLVGGDKACANEKVVFAEGSLNWAPKGVASCYEFTAPVTARYLRTTAADYIDFFALIGLTTAPRLQLCAKPCPNGTEPPPPAMTDAGTDARVP